MKNILLTLIVLTSTSAFAQDRIALSCHIYLTGENTVALEDLYFGQEFRNEVKLSKTLNNVTYKAYATEKMIVATEVVDNSSEVSAYSHADHQAGADSAQTVILKKKNQENRLDCFLRKISE